MLYKNKRWKLAEVVTDRDVVGIAATEIDATLVSEIEQSTKQNPEDKEANIEAEETDDSLEEKVIDARTRFSTAKKTEKMAIYFRCNCYCFRGSSFYSRQKKRKSNHCI